MQPTDPITASFVSLGCPKNLVDSERMLALLAESGIVPVGPDDPADVVIINTCGFIESARAEALEHIQAELDRKTAGEVSYVVVAGCLAQLSGDSLLQQCPGVDAVVGLAQRDQLSDLIKSLITEQPRQPLVTAGPFKKQMLSDQTRLRLTEPSWAYLRISEGCSLGCAFCTIPRIRGPFRSKPLDAVLAEAAELVADGAVELNLIGQETTGYGRDLDLDDGLARLLREFEQFDALQWVRVLYAHPATLSPATIDAMAQCRKVVPYLDIPLQHISDRILKRMNRRIDRAATEQLLTTLRRAIPDITIRTTMLVGFPSETDAEFTELLEFVKQQRFQALGAFAYSAEDHTKAAHLPDHLDDNVKQERLAELMLTQQQIAFEQADVLIGAERPCLVTGPLDPADIDALELDEDAPWFLARHIGQAAEIDSECFLRASDDTDPTGTIQTARITARTDYDLIGHII